ncbi:MAG: reverse gyrase [Sulfolobales archaeon]
MKQIGRELLRGGSLPDVPEAIYRWACPNCGLSSPTNRLAAGIPCERCIDASYIRRLPITSSIEELHRWVYSVLKEKGRLEKRSVISYESLIKVEDSVDKFSELFRKCIGRDPWSLQKMWAKRVITGSSFALIAPTGVGKTTFGIIMAIFLALERNWRSVIIVPTIPLADQLYKRANEYLDKASLGKTVRVEVYHSRIPQQERKEIIERLSRGEFDILITTSAFFRNEDNTSLIKGKINFFFVDDVDSILRGGKILDHVLYTMGIERDLVEKALTIVDLKAKTAFKEDSGEILAKISDLKKDIEKSRRKDLVLVISSATGRARGRRIKVLREIFGFEIGARYDVIRNVADLYYVAGDKEDLVDIASKLVKKLGSGGIIYVPKDLGIEYAEKISEILSKRTGLRVAPLTSRNVKTIDGFANREIDVVVGVSTYYGVAVRGIDLPDVIRYAIFLEAPRHRIALDIKEIEIQDIPRILELAIDIIEDSNKKEELTTTLNKVLKILRRSSPTYLKEAFEKARRGETSSWAERVLKEAIDAVNSVISEPGFLSKLERNPYTKVERVGDRIYVYIPDWATYIQASGRTSRLYVGGISKGLSIILEKDPRMLRGLERRLKIISDEISLKRLDEVNIDEILREIDLDRDNIRKARQGILHISLGDRVKELTRTVLIIVESPNKARTIASFFGRPSVKELGEIRVYEASLGNLTLLITASGGHLYDLAVDDLDNYLYSKQRSLYGVIVESGRYIPVYTTIKKCRRCGNQFTNDPLEGELRCPICGSNDIRDSRSTIEALRKAALEVDEIYIATDPDTEGEKIAFDLYIALKPYNNRIKRIEFHEVTRRAFINAINNPRDIDLNRVRAQLVRRIEDRWIGFILSQKVTDHLKEEEELDLKYRLSAGRVQTPVLGWVVTSTREHKKGKYFIARLQIGEREPQYLLEIPLSMFTRKPNIGDKVTIHIDVVESHVEELSPPPPYTTDTMLVDISQYLRIPAPRVMDIAQDLFELGLITYHRTDSTRVSDYGIEIAKSYMAELGKLDLLRPRRWGEGGAHEAIRPTRPLDLDMLGRMLAEGLLDIRLSRDHMKVYDLIFRRFIASQSIPARVKVCIIGFEVRDSSGTIAQVTSKEICDIVEKGFMEFYSHQYRLFPKTLIGRDVEVVVSSENFRGERLYTPGDLIRMMKHEGIGRPSTYAKIVDIILRRYIVKSFFKKTGYLVSNKYGRRVYDYLSKEYNALVNIDRTRKLEEKMDQIERGSTDYIEVLNELYNELKSYRLVEGG